MCNWPGRPEKSEKGKRPQKRPASPESDTAEETEAEEPPPKKKLRVERMPRDQPAGTTFLQAVLWIVWELRALRSVVVDTREYIGNQLNAIGVSALDEVQLTRRWGRIRTELRDSAVEVLREDLARAGIVIPEPKRAAATTTAAVAGNAQDAEMREAGPDAGAEAGAGERQEGEEEKTEPGPGPEEPAARGKRVYKYL